MTGGSWRVTWLTWRGRELTISASHGGPGEGEAGAFDRVYANSAADIATWHFSRDRRTDDGWKPVYDCWDFADRPGCPPVSSNEPIGPGSSVNTEAEPLRLVMAAAFGYAAKLPMYVFHCEAGLFGKQRFEETPAVDRFTQILRLLPADLPNWQRHDGKDANAPFTLLEPDGCVRLTGSRQADRFVGVPIGIRSGGVALG